MRARPLVVLAAFTAGCAGALPDGPALAISIEPGSVVAPATLMARLVNLGTDGIRHPPCDVPAIRLVLPHGRFPFDAEDPTCATQGLAFLAPGGMVRATAYAGGSYWDDSLGEHVPLEPGVYVVDAGFGGARDEARVTVP